MTDNIILNKMKMAYKEALVLQSLLMMIEKSY